jgi:hypothetical protein
LLARSGISKAAALIDHFRSRELTSADKPNAETLPFSDSLGVAGHREGAVRQFQIKSFGAGYSWLFPGQLLEIDGSILRFWAKVWPKRVITYEVTNGAWIELKDRKKRFLVHLPGGSRVLVGFHNHEDFVAAIKSLEDSGVFLRSRETPQRKRLH